MIFADSRLFLETKHLGMQIFAETRCLSQETAENRRNPQKTADWRLSPWVRPLKRGPKGRVWEAKKG